LKSVRYRARRYPAFIVGGTKYIGNDFSHARSLIDQAVVAQPHG
jgi:hypothetical protein